ncbi:hypothetical protein SBRCBS47491_007574 [Sporothrix bragantina]|uniref:Uncharacterized protein n=1 Tax=Sporothrix bragantina TaxID=671064 RepID=A0ABP0CED6_9PEZI
MTFHRNQAQFVRARWRRTVLFPVWSFQVIVLLGILGIFSYRLAETAEHFDENHKAGKTPTVELVWEVTNVGFGVLCLVLTIMEASRLLAETLTPYFLLAAHVIKMTCAAAMLALDIVVYINRSEGNWSTVGLALDVALLAAMVALFVYAIVTFRRQQGTYDDFHFHHPASNTKAFGYGSGYDEIELNGGGAGNRSMRNSTSGLVSNSAGMGMGGGGVASGDVFLRAGSYNDAPTEYDPNSLAGGMGGGSGSRSRSHSAASVSSLRGPFTPSPGTGTGAVTPDDGRRASYNHERDTQFDSYVMNRASTAALSKDDIDHAISQELWGAGLPLSAVGGNSGGGAGTAAVERSNSIVATGVVASHQPIMPSTPQRETIGRTVSWSVEHGLVSVPESVNEDDGHTLRTVGSVATMTIAEEEYEGHEGHERVGAQNYGGRARDEVDEVDDEALAHGRLRTKGANEDRALLMGHSRQGSLDEDEEDDERGPIPDLAPHGHA